MEDITTPLEQPVGQAVEQRQLIRTPVPVQPGKEIPEAMGQIRREVVAAVRHPQAQMGSTQPEELAAMVGPGIFMPVCIMEPVGEAGQPESPALEVIIPRRPEQPVLGMVVTTMVSPRMQLPTLDPVVEVAAVTQEAKQT